MDSNIDRLNELWRCRTPQDWLTVQSELMRENVESVLNGGRRMADLSTKLADDATRTVAESDRMRRAA